MEFKDLRSARKAARKTQAELGSEVRLDQGDVSRLESGEKLMSDAVASRLAPHLGPGVSQSDLLISNKSLAFKRAMQKGDKASVLLAAKSFVRYAESLPSDPELEATLDRLVAKREQLDAQIEQARKPVDGLTGQRRRLEIEHYDALGEANSFEEGTEAMS